MTKTLYYMLDLVDDAGLIAEYDDLHRAESAWPEVTQGLLDAGIISLDIHRYRDRLVMTIVAGDEFDPADKARSEGASARVREWEKMMERFQRALLGPPGAKWRAATKIYSLTDVLRIRRNT